jgi:hypothetical protein
MDRNDRTKSDVFVATQVRNLISSDAFPVRAAVAGLLLLVEANVGPLAVRRGVVGSPAVNDLTEFLSFTRLRDADEHDHHALLRKAVEEGVGVEFGTDAVVAATGAPVIAFSTRVR